MMVQEIAHQAERAGAEAKFDAGKTIIEHVSNAREHPILHLPTILGLDFSITKHVMMLWLVAAASFSRLLVLELWLSFLYGSHNGAMIAYLTEIMPANIRTTGFSLAYSLATAIFGGFTPAISTYLIHVTNNRAIPGLWLSFAAMCGVVAAILSKPYREIQETETAVA